MEGFSKQVLLVGDFQLDALLSPKAETQPTENGLRFSRVSTYQNAIQFIEYGHWDAVLVYQDFDSHTGLEFVHHARLIDADTPIVLITEAEDHNLDYKGRRLGANDAICANDVDRSYLSTLFIQRRKPAQRAKKNPSRPLFSRVVRIFID